jgi:hypothetical protein
MDSMTQQGQIIRSNQKVKKLLLVSYKLNWELKKIRKTSLVKANFMELEKKINNLIYIV